MSAAVDAAREALGGLFPEGAAETRRPRSSATAASPIAATRGPFGPTSAGRTTGVSLGQGLQREQLLPHHDQVSGGQDPTNDRTEGTCRRFERELCHQPNVIGINRPHEIRPGDTTEENGAGIERDETAFLERNQAEDAHEPLPDLEAVEAIDEPPGAAPPRLSTSRSCTKAIRNWHNHRKHQLGWCSDVQRKTARSGWSSRPSRG